MVQKGDEVFGDTVNLAARLCEHAGSGQIITTEWTAKLLSPLYRAWLRQPGKHADQGPLRRDRAVRAGLARRRQRHRAGAPPRRRTQRPQQVVLRLTYRGRTLERRREKDAITIGRGEDCGMVVADENASRHHCTIERRKDKFVLVDVSTNGTYVTVEGEKEVLLQREEFVLRKRGSITFGTPLVAAADGVEFDVE